MGFESNVLKTIAKLALATSFLCSASQAWSMTCKETFVRAEQLEPLFKELAEGTATTYGDYYVVTTRGVDTPSTRDPDGGQEKVLKVIIFQYGQKVGEFIGTVSEKAMYPTPLLKSAYFTFDMPTSLAAEGMHRSFVEKIVTEYQIEDITDTLTGEAHFPYFVVGKMKGLSDIEAYGETQSGKLFKKLGFEVESIYINYDVQEISVSLVKSEPTESATTPLGSLSMPYKDLL